MRMLRDRIPGVGYCYIQFPPAQLVAKLKKHSPILQVARAASEFLRAAEKTGPESGPAESDEIKENPAKENFAGQF
jgi:hypothetical protein